MTDGLLRKAGTGGPDVYTRLWLSQLLPEEEYGSSPDCNTTRTQFTARKPHIAIMRGSWLIHLLVHFKEIKGGMLSVVGSKGNKCTEFQRLILPLKTGSRRVLGGGPGAGAGGMQPEEELMSSLGPILARIEEMRQEQAEENRRFLETFQGPPALRPTPEPQYPSELPTSEPQEPPTSEPLALSIPEPQESSEPRTPEPQGPGELPTSEPQDPAALPTTPVPRDPSAEGRPRFPVTRRRCRPLIPGARRRRLLPLPRLHPGQSQLPVPDPQSPLLPVPVPSPHVPRPVPQSPSSCAQSPRAPSFRARFPTAPASRAHSRSPRAPSSAQALVGGGGVGGGYLSGGHVLWMVGVIWTLQVSVIAGLSLIQALVHRGGGVVVKQVSRVKSAIRRTWQSWRGVAHPAIEGSRSGPGSVSVLGPRHSPRGRSQLQAAGHQVAGGLAVPQVISVGHSAGALGFKLHVKAPPFSPIQFMLTRLSSRVAGPWLKPLKLSTRRLTRAPAGCVWYADHLPHCSSLWVSAFPIPHLQPEMGIAARLLASQECSNDTWMDKNKCDVENHILENIPRDKTRGILTVFPGE
ncbi:hypothetical protein EYF80_008461 [Liparis tanakae]|uniref:Uncharacterized protein n=1 Tax=Liparis tanakae TaxID=230148 RepID=A0A4Z2IU36_9TELE|nr:hypothetical protein EYF80_008461 [Liparis tanakae]